MAMREELALEHWRALRDVAISYDVHYDALLELVEDHTLYALYTDTDWYIEPDECARTAVEVIVYEEMTKDEGVRARRENKASALYCCWFSDTALAPSDQSAPVHNYFNRCIPALVPQALKPVPSKPRQRLRGPVTTVEPSTQVELPFTPAAPPILPLAVCPHEEERREPEWLHFREAVRQSEFTHSELHRAMRQGEVKSMRHAQGYLLVCMKSLEDYTPARHWLTLETYASSMTTRARSLLLKRLQSGERPGRLMNGTWYLEP